ncbi:WGxxGxxG family protein [Nostoc sp.]|uniref:WGxxGxxG family protein n=1 Tax=Nostoc sp. TaxID=1180 RepID=UPI002FFA9900
MTTSQPTSDHGFDWGWLGLLGLGGLFGFLPRNRDKIRAYRDPNEVTGSPGSK